MIGHDGVEGYIEEARSRWKAEEELSVLKFIRSKFIRH